MISEKVTMKSCVGKYAVLDKDVHTLFGYTKGLKVKIISSNRFGMTIWDEKNQYSISRVKKDDLTLLEDGAK